MTVVTTRSQPSRRPMLSGLLLGVVLALISASCGDGGSPDAGPISEVAPANAQIGTSPPTSTADGFEIPDIEFTLADGSQFDLGDIDTPIMMVFWAEW